MPCGACRQVMSEFAGDDLRVLIEGAGNFRLGELLQYAYKLAIEK
jgi:cytidine deaminase